MKNTHKSNMIYSVISGVVFLLESEDVDHFYHSLLCFYRYNYEGVPRGWTCLHCNYRRNCACGPKHHYYDC